MKTYGKNIFRTIRGSLSRFLAIFAIVALGVGFLAGLLVSPMDMRLSADALYDETHLYDLRVVSTLGLTEEDVEAVSAVEGVEGLFPAYDTDLVLLSEEGDSLTARVHSLPEDTSEENANYLTRPQLLEGRMPEEPGGVRDREDQDPGGRPGVGRRHPDGGRGRGRRGGGQLPPCPRP